MASSQFNHECIVTKDFSGTTDAGGNLNISSLVPGTATIIGYNSRVGFVPYKYSDTGWALRATTVDSNGFQKILANTAVSGSVTYRPWFVPKQWMASSIFNRSTQVIFKTYTLTYYGANSLRANPIDIPAGCNIHRMVILPPGYNGVSLKGTNFQIVADTGIGYFGSGFTSSDTMQVTCVFFL